ncbi:MAG: radical SAM protein [Bacteroidales bacterium]|jgi:radical SAM superfamily enzyme YgiQ (UPF0313 family)|nr:radical SAM protein [Bacteroidales bacterium]
MKKLLLISANTFRDPYPVYPLGVTYLKTYLLQTLPALEVKIFDCNMSTLEDLSVIVRSFDVVGISFRNMDGANSLDSNTFLDGYKKIVDVVRSASDKPLIIGGAAFSLFPEIFMQELQADYGIAGEGEESLRQLLGILLNDNNAADFTSIEGLYCKKNINGTTPHKCYLSSIHAQFDSTLADYYWKESGMLNIQTKRGCPYHCVYCSYPIIDGRKVRTLDPDQIVENLLQLRRDKNISYIFFTDSIFNIHNDYNVELAEKIIHSNLKISWGAYFSPHNLTDELLKIFKMSGLTHIEFGTESLCDKTLASYGKSFNYSQILNTSELALKHNIFYSHFLILGGVGETQDTLNETIEHSKDFRYTVFFPFVGMRIYPKTQLQQIALSEGIISQDDTLVDSKYYLMKDFDLEDIRQKALATGKAWVFPDNHENDELMRHFRLNKNKKGPIWEYLRKP